MSRHALAWIYVSLGRQSEAATLFEALLPLCRTTFGEGFPITLVDTSALGAAYRVTGRLGESHELLAATLASFEANISKTTHNPHIAVVQRQFGLTLIREGRYAEAEAILRQALSEYDHFELMPLPKRLCPRAGVISGIGLALTGEGRYAEAEPLLLQAYEELQANNSRLAGNSTAMMREALDALVELYTAWAKTDPSKKPMVSTWQKNLEEFDGRHAQQADLSASKT
jgi:tetratricopeptide (TPR) repeat protein